MTGRISTSLASFLVLIAGACASPHTQADIVQNVAGASRTSSISVLYGQTDSQRGTLRIPSGEGPFPVVVLIHGGCWTRGFATLVDIEPFGEALAQRGVAVWNIEYRQMGEAGAGWPGTFEDVLNAIDELPRLAQVHPLDLQRVSFVGHSAGAHLAAFAAARQKREGAAAVSGKVRPVSVVMVDGPAELAPLVGPDEDICGQPVIVPLMGGTPTDRSERYALVSARRYLPLGVSQLFVVGELAPFMSSYVEEARAAGDPVHLIAPDGATHFDLISPGTASGRDVVEFVVKQAFDSLLRQPEQ